MLDALDDIMEYPVYPEDPDDIKSWKEDIEDLTYGLIHVTAFFCKYIKR